MNKGKNIIALSVIGALAPFAVACGAVPDLQDEGIDQASDPGIEAPASVEQAVCIDLYRYATAFRGNNGHLWVDTNRLWKGDTGGSIVPNTSPSIAQLQGNKYVVAFQGYPNNHLWLTTGTANSQTGQDTGLQVAPNTSPSVTRLSDAGSYAVAYQDTQNELWIHVRYSNGSSSNVHALCSGTPCKMNPGTSPSIAAYTDGSYEVAFQSPLDANGDTLLAYYGNWWTEKSGYGMLGGTSPSIAWVSGWSDYAMAFDANTSKLWIVDDWTFEDQSNQPMASSPSIASNGSSYTVAYRRSTDSKLCSWVAWNGQGTGCTNITMKQNTSPSIAVWNQGYEIAVQGSDGYLYYSGPMCKTGRQTARLNNTSSPSIAVAALNW